VTVRTIAVAGAPAIVRRLPPALVIEDPAGAAGTRTPVIEDPGGAGDKIPSHLPAGLWIMRRRTGHEHLGPPRGRP